MDIEVDASQQGKRKLSLELGSSNNKTCSLNLQANLAFMLMVWFRTQNFQVRWENKFSSRFSVSTSVRQGRISLPFYSAVNLDELSELLLVCRVGCRIGGHFCFADDVELLTTSHLILPSIIAKLYVK